MPYFGTNGVRGRFDELTPELALRVAQATGMYLGRGKIILARDCRLTGDVLRSSVAAGLAGVGCDVIDLGIASSPTAEFMIKELGAKGCVMITASHNPPEWNAIKVVDGRGVAVSRERGAEIEKLMGNAALARWDSLGRIEGYGNAAAAHIGAIKKLVDVRKIMKRKPKVVLDCGNGTACTIAPALFKELGCEVLTLNSHIDGRFPGRASEPSEENVRELMAMVRSARADAGAAWDADGDRVIFVDGEGGYVIGDRVYALSVMWKKQKGDVVTTVATSRAVEDVASRLGSRVRYTAIGAPFLCEEMLRKPAAIGGEEVGGVIWPELSLAKDGFMTAARMAEALCEKPLTSWLRDVPAYYNVKHRIEADERKKVEIVARVHAYAEKKGLDHTDMDGVRVNLKDAWVIVRASGTEPCVRVFAEAKSQAEARRLCEEYEKIAKG
jgi:phosphomannomutase/phosphoglucomutase